MELEWGMEGEVLVVLLVSGNAIDGMMRGVFELRPGAGSEARPTKDTRIFLPVTQSWGQQERHTIYFNNNTNTNIQCNTQQQLLPPSVGLAPITTETRRNNPRPRA